MTKLSSQTIDILKNFSGINSNLVVKAGEPLSTISEAKNIMAIADITEQFSADFGIYDLNEFISMFSLLQDPDLEFTNDSVQFKSGRTRASYRFADQSILTSPKNKINMPQSDLTVHITSELLTQVRKAAGVLGHSIVSLKGEDGTVTLSVVDPKNSSANTFSVVLDENNSQHGSFDLQFLINNLKVLPGDYVVNISSKLISHWKNENTPVQYYIALEKTSTFNN
jgi:DNA polymerase III sliding clamp (beta) subunit (PCNA family)